jgi:hypothetical protein
VGIGVGQHGVPMVGGEAGGMPSTVVFWVDAGAGRSWRMVRIGDVFSHGRLMMARRAAIAAAQMSHTESGIDCRFRR